MKYPQVLIDEMRLRGFSKKTIKAYLYWNDAFLSFTRKAPLDVCEAEVRAFLLDLDDRNISSSSRHLATAALKFYFQGILKRRFRWVYPRVKVRVPDILSHEEIVRMITVTENPKHRLLIELMYSSGLRVSEAVGLRKEDVLLNQKLIKVRNGKGNKERMVILSQYFLDEFVKYVKEHKDESPFVFPSESGNPHITIRTAQMIVQDAARKAKVGKRIGCHILRHSFATHLLESGTDIRYIQKLLGHSRLETTSIYTHVARKDFLAIRSPLDSAIE